MVALAHARLAPREPVSLRLASTYLSFLQHAQLDDGRFHNFMAYDRTWSDEIGTHDSCGRAIWALGYGLANVRGEPWRRVCAMLLDRALPSLDSLEYLRSRAYAALGLASAYEAARDPKYADALRRLADEILAAYEATADADWPWFEDILTYDNARLPEALLRAGRALRDERYTSAALASLKFYEEVTLENGVHVPIGNEGWYRRGQNRARYVQQPLEASAMVDAELAAFDATGDTAHFTTAELALEWYHGKNSRGIPMAHGGGCYDGLGEDAVNSNEGAESTLAFLAASCAMAQRRAGASRSALVAANVAIHR